jgi:hypothetical protein
VAHRSSPARKGPTECALDPCTSPSVVEGLARLILVEHPKVDRSTGPMSEKTCRGVGHELRADTQSFEMAHDVQVFEKGPHFGSWSKMV